jgi:hypothetical protein
MALLNRVTIEQQVAILAEIGVTVNEGFAIDDLIEFEDRDEFELQPYVGLIEALGCEIEREPFTPEQKARFDEICKIKLILIEEQA